MRLSRKGVMQDNRVKEARLAFQYTAASMRSGQTVGALPLAVFVQLLGGGDGSMLYTSLVREQKLASSVSAQIDILNKGPATLRIVAVPVPGVSVVALEAALQRTLDQMLKQPPTAAQLARAKTQLKAEAIYAQDGLQAMAMTLASLFAIGLDEQFFHAWSAQIDAVTAEAALAAARDVISPSRQVTGYLLPKPPEPPVAPLPAAAVPAPTHPILEVPYGP
jgi:zinc protease